MSRCVATIVSANYLAYARVLGASLAVHEPDAAFEVLVVDRPDPAVRDAFEAAGLRATFATELGLADFEQIAFRFDLLELNTALKPTFLKALFARGFDEVVYLDPDIRLYAPLEPVTRALAGAETVLIPHALAPVMDGKRPSDIDFLRSGVFNLGFAAFRRGVHSAALLDWWERRCLGWGFNDQTFGIFVDQKWMDLAPCYFEAVQVLRHPGCNVAYWNLHDRVVDGRDGAYTVNGGPLVFFHFSGVDASRPGVLSRHQNRHTPAPGSALAELVRDYCEALLAAGHEQWRKLPYSFGRLDDGTAVTPMMRRAACLSSVPAEAPFSARSPLQQQLRRAGLARSGTGAFAKANTMNLDQGDRRVAMVNRVLRVFTRLAGPDAVGALLRYGSFLGWQSNLAAVLLDKPFDLEHQDRR